MSKLKLFLCAILLSFPLFLSIPKKGNWDSGYVNYPHELEKEKECLVDALWHEARGEGEEGIKAVLSVIQNRKRNPKFPSTYCKVIYQPQQFSFISHGKAPNRAYKSSEKEVKGLIDSLAYDAIYGGFKNSFDNPDVLYYHTKQVKPRWSRKMQKVADLGRHQFFKERL